MDYFISLQGCIRGVTGVHLELATRLRPTPLKALRLCLDQLATSAAELLADVETLDADPESQLRWWTQTFARQCRDELDELTLLAPWTELMSSEKSFEEGDFPAGQELEIVFRLGAGRVVDDARTLGDVTFAERCEREAAGLRRNIENHGWDGEWYRHAYFDDGSPLGSASNPECQIDSIAQS